MKTTTDNNARSMLLDMAKGQRSGYWVEVLHRESDGAPAYALHGAPLRAGYTWRDVPIFPHTYEAMRVQYAAYTNGGDIEADGIPTYDEHRTFVGDILGADNMRALMKWAKTT